MRIALGITYDGQAYSGWQSQPDGRTVQDHLERALERFATQPVRTLCAGRTDAGVHALMQVAHFDTEVERPLFSWVRGTNRFLPPDIAVQWARVVPQAFHARASATARRYSYILLQSPVRPSLESGRVGWVFGELDQQAMEAGAQYLLGTHDFTSLRAAICQAASPVKTMRHIGIRRCGAFGQMASGADAAYWRFDFEADAFLHHMIRNIMGCLLAIGQGRQPPQWMQAVLDARSRDAAAPTFSAHGLYFLGPVYDASWGVPQRTPGFDWLPQ